MLHVYRGFVPQVVSFACSKLQSVRVALVSLTEVTSSMNGTIISKVMRKLGALLIGAPGT